MLLTLITSCFNLDYIIFFNIDYLMFLTLALEYTEISIQPQY